MLAADPAEQVLVGMAEATGLRQTTCPWWALRDPFVAAVRQAHRWWGKGQLGARESLPAALAYGLDIYDSALNAARCAEIDHQRDEDKRKSKARQSLGGARMARGRR